MNLFVIQKNFLQFTNHYIDLKNASKLLYLKHNKIISKYLLVIHFLLLYVNMTYNIDHNKPALSSKKSGKRKNLIFKVQKKIRTELFYNLIINRTTSFICNFRNFFSDSTQIPCITLKNGTVIYTNKDSIYDSSIISSYLENFYSPEYFDVLIKTGNLSYFDGFKCEINLFKQKAVLNAYLKKLKNIGSLFIKHKKIIRKFNDSYISIIEYINSYEKSLEELEIHFEGFFKNIMNSKIKYDRKEIELDVLAEKCKEITNDLMDRFIDVRNKFNSIQVQCLQPLALLYLKLTKYQKRYYILKLDNILGESKLLLFKYDGFILIESIDWILSDIKKPIEDRFALLCDKNKYQTIKNQLISWYNKKTKSLLQHIQEKIKTIEKIYAEETVNKCDKQLMCGFVMNKRNIKNKKIHNIKGIIDIILDDLTIFFIFKIYTKSMSDNFVGYLRDKMCENIYLFPDYFAQFVAEYDTCKNKKNNSVENSTKKYSKKDNRNSKVFSMKEFPIEHQDFFIFQFGEDIFNIIDDMDVTYNDFNRNILEVENFILEWHCKFFFEDFNEFNINEFSHNKLLKLFIKEYIRRQKTINVKYVEFYNLDKNKYLNEKENLLPFENLGYKTEELLEIIHESQYAENVTI